MLAVFGLERSRREPPSRRSTEGTADRGCGPTTGPTKLDSGTGGVVWQPPLCPCRKPRRVGASCGWGIGYGATEPVRVGLRTVCRRRTVVVCHPFRCLSHPMCNTLKFFSPITHGCPAKLDSSPQGLYCYYRGRDIMNDIGKYISFFKLRVL